MVTWERRAWRKCFRHIWQREIKRTFIENRTIWEKFELQNISEKISRRSKENTHLIPSKPTETRVISHFFKRRTNRESTIGDRHFDNYGCSLHFLFRNYHLCHHYRKLASQVTEFAEEKKGKK